METKKEEIIYMAKKTTHYCDLLIKQSDSWLSEKEGLKNVKKISDKAITPTLNKKNV